MKTKLELTWYGKDEESHVEPRILIENEELSNIDNDKNTKNMLIHGDNLLALKALEKDYSNKIKCIYIDPPYNTGSAFEHYDDNLEHSIWLSLMRSRLEILQSLLTEDGLIFIQIDDNEQAYLKVLLDEIFGRNNFITTIVVKMSTASGVKTTHREKTIIKEKEMILVFSKNKDKIKLNPQYIPITNWDTEFQYFLETNNSEKSDDWDVLPLKQVLADNNIQFDFSSSETQNFLYENKDKIWRRAFIRNQFKKLSQDNPKKIFTNTSNTGKTSYYYGGREMFFLKDKYKICFTSDGKKERMANLLGDFWNDINTSKLFSEGGVEFRNSKKPEQLIHRILSLATNENDFVLDSFLGSGTTAAVAHKMKRKWIGIEMGDHAYSHCKVRIDKVISGIDNGGVSKSLDWQGGGGYRFYELAPSLINIDEFGEPVINKDYNADMLASAVALHEGYTYEPSESIFWKQSKANEHSYLFVTTRHVSLEYLNSIVNTMEENEFLVISCKSFDESIDKVFKNIVIKKIPQMLLERCEFGKDNYNLNIINPPIFEDEDEDEDYADE